MTTLARMLLLVAAPVVALTLRYDYGDGSFYVGEVDSEGKPSGIGRMFSTNGELGEIFKSQFENLHWSIPYAHGIKIYMI